MGVRGLRAAPVLALLLASGALTACGDDSGARADGPCHYQSTGAPARPVDPPPGDPASQRAVTIRTNRGDIGVTLLPDRAPCTVGSFLSLAKQGYFDDTRCHRLVVGFVLQCGDPTGTGSGGPGYRFSDELDGHETYPPGTLAMANAGPDTNGSQFFIVLHDAGLEPAFTVFGHVDAAGLQVARDIAKEGNAPDGIAPKRPVVIESVG